MSVTTTLISVLSLALAAYPQRIVIEAITPDPPVVQGVGSETSVTIAVIDHPAITAKAFAIEMQVDCRDISDGQAATLELLVDFPDGQQFFSRQVFEIGGAEYPGEGQWRNVQLPFMLSGTTDTPTRLTVNISLSSGAVAARHVQLVEFPAGDVIPPPAPGVWWSAHISNWIGAIAGPILGLLAAAVGITSGAFRQHRIALLLLAVMAVISVPILIAAIAALLLGQPYDVYYMLLLPGLIGTILPLVLQRTLRKRLQHDELRKMQSLDAA
jgi:hypothetical protein